MYDVVALGELLIDFTPAGISQSGNALFEKNPGGAPSNVLCTVSKLGGKGALIGKVGKDQFGAFLEDVLKKHNIETKGLKFSEKINTTLAFIHLNEKGDRSFSFYRNPGADMMLSTEDVDFEIIDEAKIFHFGSLSMTGQPSAGATKAALKYAKNKGKIITYDPNWRPPLWESNEAAKAAMLYGMQFADIVKVSEDEFEFLTNTRDFAAGSRQFLDKGVKIVLVSLGAKGCYYACRAGSGILNTYDTRVVDTTGAGDAFFGALLYQISRYDGEIEAIRQFELEEMIDFSNATGALCATKKGAIDAIPSFAEIENCRKSISKLAFI